MDPDRPATKAHTGGVDERERRWRLAVEQAALTNDRASLRTLYAEAVELFGPSAPTHWSQALSAYDASAITG